MSLGRHLMEVSKLLFNLIIKGVIGDND